MRSIAAAATGLLCFAGLVGGSVWGAGQVGQAPSWVQAMRDVHVRFTGKQGTFAHFGDSITVSRAYWSGLRWDAKGLSPAAEAALKRVRRYMLEDCWDKWKGAEFGNEGSTTIRWAEENVIHWLSRLNPEVALIMFGTNDLNQVPLEEYRTRLHRVAGKCLDNGTVVILSTIPPRSGHLEKSQQYAQAIRDVARELKVPLVDYHREILIRRPDDWDGSLPQFRDTPGDEYQTPTLICRDGVHPSNPRAYANDYSEQALRCSGYNLRTYLSLLAYAEVIEGVLDPR